MTKVMIVCLSRVVITCALLVGFAQQVGAQSPSASPSATVSPAASATPTGPVPLFSPQDNRFKFPIPLPQLGDRFTNDGNLLTSVIDFIITVLTYIVGGVAFGYLIYGGIRYMTAGGDPGRVDGARKTIIGAIIGMFVAALAYVIVEFLISTITNAIT